MQAGGNAHPDARAEQQSATTSLMTAHGPDRTSQLDHRHRIKEAAIVFGDGKKIIRSQPVLGRLEAVLQVDQAEQRAGRRLDKAASTSGQDDGKRS